MSDHFLVVIPADPEAALPASAEDVRAALVDMAGGEESRVKDYGKLQFIDAGENFERVACPICAAEMSKDTWRDWMDSDWHGEEGFHLHLHATTCCGEPVTLNDLVYHFPQGFARWFVSVRNAGRGPLTAEELARLETVGGLRLRAIAPMY